MEPLKQFYDSLFQAYGPQGWWPGESRFEVIAGSILTQNTAWTNVEKALGNLKGKSLLSPAGIHRLSLSRLARLIRPSGYFNIKARRLKNFTGYLFGQYGGNLGRMFRRPWRRLREELLDIKGIGPETADSILLYAGEKPVFVVDLYTRRVLARHGLMPLGIPYGDIQDAFMRRLPRRVSLFNEYHALIVRVGKEHCGAEPNCRGCPLEGCLNGKTPIF